MATMTGPKWGPKNGGAPKMIVFLLHGLGADGNDLIDLAPHWGNAAPDAVFLSPTRRSRMTAPLRAAVVQPLGPLPPARLAGVQVARPALDAMIDEACATYGLPASAVVLMGFSQGAMMALYAGLRRKEPVAGIMAYSGMLIGAETLAQEIVSRPPVLLVHGEVDEVVPAAASRQADRRCGRRGFRWNPPSAPGLATASTMPGSPPARFSCNGRRPASSLRDAAMKLARPDIARASPTCHEFQANRRRHDIWGSSVRSSPSG
ncbi:alpha/beta hydrolase [Pseudoroseomonas wenyumeiae]